MIKTRTKDKQANKFINGLVEKLEDDKAKIGAGVDPLADFDVVHTFADNVFRHADDEDRSGEANLNTAQAFMTAFCVFECLSDVNGEQLSPEVLQKIKYGKWKAADISKAIKEGRRPSPGGAGEDFGEFNEFFAESDIKKASEVDGVEEEKVPVSEVRPFEPKPCPPSLKKTSSIPSKGKIANAKALGVKDISKIKTLNSAEITTREALSALRFNDVNTAIAKLEETLYQLRSLQS
jgi:vacuolar protein sorting-associated protein VTA1